jgi:hypothetical protein
MADEMISFTQNHQDLSTEKGYQFKFICDHCGNGFLSSFEANTLGVAEGLFSAAGSLFGGVLGRTAETAEQLRRAVAGPAHDKAFRRAVEQGKTHFKQCSRCGHWVCPEKCWNADKGLCKGCAPVMEEELASAQAQVMREQINDKLRSQDLTKDVNLTQAASAACPKCGKAPGSGKFCQECGAPMARTRPCAKCKKDIPVGAKFCPECGGPA